MKVADQLSTGLECIAAGGIDAILLDLGLPDSHGFDAFAKVHAQAPQVPIVVLSGLDKETPDRMSFGYLKQRLCPILEKTKQASLASFELVVRETGPSRFYRHNQQVLACIDLAGNELRFPPSIVGTLKRAAKLHDCFRLVLGETLLTKQGPLTEEEKTRIDSFPTRPTVVGQGIEITADPDCSSEDLMVELRA